MLASDRQLPISGGPEKRAYVRSVFSTIAPTYDRLNRIISFRLDRRWRRRAVARLGWERKPRGIYLDLCAGTLELGAALAREPGFEGTVVGADFAQNMLAFGRHKSTRLLPVNADALELPFPDRAFDGVLVGWGLRNLIDLDVGLAEIARVLQSGGRLVTLDMALPSHAGLRRVYQLYFTRVMPWIGRVISKHTSAYEWLPASTRVFPEPAQLARRMEQQGFEKVHFELLMGGVCALHVAGRSDYAA